MLLNTYSAHVCTGGVRVSQGQEMHGVAGTRRSKERTLILSYKLIRRISVCACVRVSCRISLCDVRVPCRMSLYDSIRAAVVGQIYTCWPPPLAPDPDRDSGSAFRNMFPASSRALAPQFIHLSGPGTCHATGSPRRSCLSSRRPCSRCPPLPTPRSRARLEG